MSRARFSRGSLSILTEARKPPLSRALFHFLAATARSSLFRSFEIVLFFTLVDWISPKSFVAEYFYFGIMLRMCMKIEAKRLLAMVVRAALSEENYLRVPSFSVREVVFDAAASNFFGTLP